MALCLGFSVCFSVSHTSLRTPSMRQEYCRSWSIYPWSTSNHEVLSKSFAMAVRSVVAPIRHRVIRIPMAVVNPSLKRRRRNLNDQYFIPIWLCLDHSSWECTSSNKRTLATFALRSASTWCKHYVPSFSETFSSVNFLRTIHLEVH